MPQFPHRCALYQGETTLDSLPSKNQAPVLVFGPDSQPLPPAVSKTLDGDFLEVWLSQRLHSSL